MSLRVVILGVLSCLCAAADQVVAQVPAQVPARAQSPTRRQPQTLTLPAHTGYAHPEPNAIRRDTRNGTVTRCDGQLVFYVQLTATGPLHLRLSRTGDAPATELRIRVSPHPGKDRTSITRQLPASTAPDDIDIRGLSVHKQGMWRIALETTDDSPIRNVAALHLSGKAAANAHASTVERRNAASVHLGYEVPRKHRDDIEWFYCEVTPRTDPLWTYYMATGWRRGYFGMQVNSPTERRIIFSVWDAGNEAIDRKKVADDNRVKLIAKGADVHASGFGNEGTGGHSHLVHDWQLGDTFRFLVRAQPDGTHTTYTGWFWFADEQQWGLIASFRAPKDGKRLRGLYSFNENFSGSNGDLNRDCEFGNAWARTAGGKWVALRRARFTHDGHGKAQRLDRSAGVRGERFYLQNGGFLAAAQGAVTTGGSWLELPELPSAKGSPPSMLPSR